MRPPGAQAPLHGPAAGFWNPCQEGYANLSCVNSLPFSDPARELNPDAFLYPRIANLTHFPQKPTSEIRPYDAPLRQASRAIATQKTRRARVSMDAGYQNSPSTPAQTRKQR